MGRHTKDVRDGDPAEDDSRRSRGIGKVPLLPAVSGVVVAGVVVSALSTKQIALNFTGGPPAAQAGQPPRIEDSPLPRITTGPRTARDDSSLSPREGTRASRGTGRSVVSVAFRKVSTWTAGFQGQVIITNRSRTPVSGWTLMFRYPGTKIISVRDARIVRTGVTLIARNPADQPSIAPGRSVTLRFTAVGTGTQTSACSFNGVTC